MTSMSSGNSTRNVRKNSDFSLKKNYLNSIGVAIKLVSITVGA